MTTMLDAFPANGDNRVPPMPPVQAMLSQQASRSFHGGTEVDGLKSARKCVGSVQR